jgi:hypothetical protein
VNPIQFAEQFRCTTFLDKARDGRESDNQRKVKADRLDASWSGNSHHHDNSG